MCIINPRRPELLNLRYSLQGPHGPPDITLLDKRYNLHGSGWYFYNSTLFNIAIVSESRLSNPMFYVSGAKVAMDIATA